MTGDEDDVFVVESVKRGEDDMDCAFDLAGDDEEGDNDEPFIIGGENEDDEEDDEGGGEDRKCDALTP